MDDHNNDNSCLLQCFQQYTVHIVISYIAMCKLSLQVVPSFIAFFLPILPVGLYSGYIANYLRWKSSTVFVDQLITVKLFQ